MVATMLWETHPSSIVVISDSLGSPGHAVCIKWGKKKFALSVFAIFDLSTKWEIGKQSLFVMSFWFWGKMLFFGLILKNE